MTEQFEQGDTVRVSREIVVERVNDNGSIDSMDGVRYYPSDRNWSVELVKKAVHDFTNDPLGTMYENRNNPTERWIKIPSNSANWIMRRIDEPGWFDAYNVERFGARNLKPVEGKTPDESGSWWDKDGDEWVAITTEGGCNRFLLREDVGFYPSERYPDYAGKTLEGVMMDYGPLRRNK